MKDAKSEAQKEIDEYRKQKDEEFKKYEKEVCGRCRLMVARDNWVLTGYITAKQRQQELRGGSEPRVR